MSKKQNAVEPTESSAQGAGVSENSNTENVVKESPLTGLQFERVDTGQFEFFKFDRDGQSFTGTFIGILHDTERNPKSPEFTGNPDCLKYKREGIGSCIAMCEYESKAVYLLPDHYQTSKYFKDYFDAIGKDINDYVFRITRIKKQDGQTGIITFDIQKAKIVAND